MNLLRSVWVVGLIASFAQAEEGVHSPVRGYAMYTGGSLFSLPSVGQANYFEYCGAPCGYARGTGPRSTPSYAVPLVVDLELGLVVLERFRVAVEGVPPEFVVLGHVGVDLVNAQFARPGDSGAITLWLGGGYEHAPLYFATPQLFGAVASLRATAEFKWGLFILRPEVFARLQFVDVYKDEPFERTVTFLCPSRRFNWGLNSASASPGQAD